MSTHGIGRCAVQFYAAQCYAALWCLATCECLMIAHWSDYGLFVQEEVQEAAKLANAHDFILALPDGYATKVSRTGDSATQIHLSMRYCRTGQ